MIVADVNVLAYLLIPGQYTPAAESLLLAEPDWAMPRLWRSELRNVLANYLKLGQLDLNEASAIFDRAEELIGAQEFEVDTMEVLRLSTQSRCSAYDCEYVALAAFFDVQLVTQDQRLVRAFPGRARMLIEHESG